tara:strand:+ start:11676 stop:13694 length:2019 start_codon:yes stop_codon:yes gene_type:complete
MCGIFGVISKKEAKYSKSFIEKSLTSLAKFSESRGKDSSGLCVFDQKNNKLIINKGNTHTTELFKKKNVKDSLKYLHTSDTKFAFGHSRLVTNGTQLNANNNQPILKDGVIGIHNGIITNDDELWCVNPDINREYEIDTEVLLALIRKELNLTNNIEASVAKSISSIEGTASVALMFDDYDKFILATNNGSLYILQAEDIIFFASERAMMNSFINKCNLKSTVPDFKVFQLSYNTIFSVDIDSFTLLNTNFSTAIQSEKKACSEKKEKKEIKINNFTKKNDLSAVLDINSIGLRSESTKERELLIHPQEKVSKLKRCTKCVLPETFPYISFDKKGVCNYCHGYKINKRTNSLDELKSLVEPYKKKDGSPDVLVPFSGGRDSTYSVHIIKEKLGLNPITYTYDWGMVTDLARRNIARTCGKLGIENIIVAADIKKKRRNIKLNVEAWLKRPELGMIPLFMAGDKYFFYYANKMCKENNLDLAIWGSNYLENTDFKTGFCGIKPNFDKDRIDTLRVNDKMKLISFFAKNYCLNSSYINMSLVNTFGAFLSRYAIKRTGYFQLFDYFLWDEDEVNNLIIKEYNWELSVDTKNTWRIGDGTAAFYNYIYFLTAGFSEFDTFRSNQVREGMITRKEALKFIEKDNIPRYETIKWYLEIVGLNFENVIKKVNSIKRLY